VTGPRLLSASKIARVLRASAYRGAITLAVVLVAAATPNSASAFSKAIWGPVYHDGVNQFPLYHQLGVSIYEADLSWNLVAPRRPRHPAILATRATTGRRRSTRRSHRLGAFRCG
jgi:hypothetical protein